ncbi:hypothetical protein WJX84_009983 [Apatococcus fuscideae]|uniref:HMG box domain-containing protein n=1 Tax=Apatococcus fuscideae TaxID=2026836 RepID=A0AAW1T9F4_9CHLO
MYVAAGSWKRQAFCSFKQEQIQAENHDLKLGEVSKKLGDMWKLLTEEEKQPYKDLAAAEKEQLQAAQPAGTIQESNQAVSVKESKAPSEPRAKTAYNIFCQARRAYLKAESPEANSTDITRLLATTWKTMGAEERKPYIMQHKEEEAALNIQKPDVCQHHNESDLEEDRSHPAPIALMAVFNCTEDGEMDLDDLPEDSPLQACAFLGKLRETDYPLSKLVKRKHEQSDTMMRVPMLGLSFAVQRMIQAQAVEKDGIIADLQEKLEQLKGYADAQLHVLILGVPVGYQWYSDSRLCP